MEVYRRILSILKDKNIPFEEITHAPVRTTDDSARERAAQGWISGLGSKNILFHAKGKFYLVVTSAQKQIKARIFKKEFGTKDIRFAYDNEVAGHTGCEPGCVPPFGHPSAELPIYIDKEILDAEYFMFNPGTHERSIRVNPMDLIRAVETGPNPCAYFIETEEGTVIEKIFPQP